VIGGATEGIGMRPLMEADDLDVVETDVVAGTRTTVVCDAHALPFADGAFDAVVCQGVLSVLLDPVRAVEEIHRVLAPDGLVYSETAFLQQVCNGAHDFTRWTLMGHRVLFRNFDEIGAGAHNGPGMAVAWAWTGLLMSFAGRSRIAHAVLRRVGAVTSGWLTLLDRRLVHRPGGIDDAAGTWFLGRRREAPRPDHELLATYEGAVRPVGTWG
jgi:SAM-dependent methyltransferase